MITMSTLSFGEILWDKLPEGDRIGGAAFNISAHLARADEEVYLLSAIGRDCGGDAALREVRRMGIRDDLLSFKAEYPTGNVTVKITPDGQPEYVIHDNGAWDNIALSEKQRHFIQDNNWVFSFLGRWHNDPRQTGNYYGRYLI